nr:lipopolysaccharide biosynthesis protein [Leptolyngbya sp. FACHB-671]
MLNSSREDKQSVSRTVLPPKLESVKQLVLKKVVNNDFTRNLGWLSIAQLAIRVSRLAATVILPRFLTPHDYGLAALVLTTYEFTQTFTKIGIFAKVIQSDDESLESTAIGAYWLNWIIYAALFLLQCIAAFPVAWFYNDDQLILPICVLALTLLVSPFGRVQSALIQRENRFKTIAIAQAARYGTANILTAVFAFMGMGMWAIVLPRLLAAPIEFVIYLMNHPWRPNKGFTTEKWGIIFNFGINILGINLLKTLRENLDYLLVGRFLGVTQLGTYFFAYNAGLGISLTIIQSIMTALYPHLCKLRSQFAAFKKGYFKSLKTIGLIITPFVLLQSGLAPFYVPILFGEQWTPAIPILVLICLSAIPRAFDSAAFSLLAAVDETRLGLIGNVMFTAIFAVSILVGVHWGVVGVAIAVLLAHAIFIPLYTAWATRYVFAKQRALAQA